MQFFLWEHVQVKNVTVISGITSSLDPNSFTNKAPGRKFLLVFYALISRAYFSRQFLWVEVTNFQASINQKMERVGGHAMHKGLKFNIRKTKIIASGPITSQQIDGETVESMVDFIFWGSKITADGDCSHEIERHILLGRKVMTNLDSILKSRGIILSTKVCLVKAMVFPVVMYGCESWTIKKAERWRIDAFALWCWRRLLRVPWTARRSNQSILKKISHEYPLEGLMLKLKLQYFGHWMQIADLFEKTLMLGKI